MYILRWCLASLFLMTLACQTKPKQEKETAVSTGAIQEDSILALATRPGADAPRSAADRLVRALYFEHSTKDNPLRETNDRSLIDQFFTQSTADLIWKRAQKMSGDVNRAKINLLFNALDAAIKKTWVEPAAIGGSKSIVYVTFLNNNKPGDIRVELDQITGNRWRIAEITYPDSTHLTELLK